MDFNQIYTDLRSIIKGQWSEVVNTVVIHGIHEAELLAEIDFTQITPPYAIIFAPADWDDWDEGPMDCVCFTADVSIYYVRSADQTQETLRTKLTTLITYLKVPANEPASFQVWRVAAAGWSSSLGINREFEEREMFERAGYVTFQLIAGDLP